MRVLKMFATISFLLPVSMASAQVKGATILADSDPRGRAMLTSRFASVYNALPAPLQSSAFLMTNQSDKVIVAYVVRWSLAGSMTVGADRMYDESELLLNPSREVSGFGLEPGKTRVLLPFANLHERQVDAGHIPDVKILSSRAGKCSEAPCVATLDSVIYADGSYEGADDANLVASFSLQRNAKHDAGAAVLLALQQGQSEQQIVAKLSQISQKFGALGDMRGKRLYLRARAQWASYLMSVDHGLGLSGLRAKAYELALVKIVPLQRMTPST